MRLPLPLPLAVALALVAYGCNTPMATLGPSATAPAAPTATAGDVASGSVATGGAATPAQPTEQKLYAVWVMKGRASVDGKKPLANAELRAYDVQTGVPVSFGAFDTTTMRTLPGVARTDAEGRWQLAFLPLVGERVVRLVARTKEHTVVTLFTSTGRVISSPPAGAAGKYRLQANPLFQNQLWWFGTFNPPPPPPQLAEIFTFSPLASLPGFLLPIMGWFNPVMSQRQACVLGSNLLIGPCGTTTVGTGNGCSAYRLLDDCNPSEPAQADPPPVEIDANTTLQSVFLETGKVQFNIKQEEFSKAVEQATGDERSVLKDSLDAIEKAIQNTTIGSTFDAFASEFFTETGTVTDATRFSNTLSQGSGVFKSSFQAILNYVDVVFESDPVATATSSPPPALFPPGRSGGGAPAPAPVGITSGLFTLVTGYPGDPVRYNVAASTTFDVAFNGFDLHVSTADGIRRVSLGSLGPPSATSFQAIAAAGPVVFYGSLDSLTDPVVWKYQAGIPGPVASTTARVEGLRYWQNGAAYPASRPVYVLTENALEEWGPDLEATSRQVLFALAPGDLDSDFAIDESQFASRTFYVASRSESSGNSTVSLWKYVEGANPASETLGAFVVGAYGEAPRIEFDPSGRHIYLSLTRGWPYSGYASVIYRIHADTQASQVIAGINLDATATFVGAADDNTTPTSGRIAKVTGMAIDVMGRKLYLSERSQDIDNPPEYHLKYGRVRQLDLP